MVIRVGYRFSTNDTEWTQMDVPYTPEDSRIYVMTEAITEENQVLDTTKVLNSDQHLEQYFNRLVILSCGDYEKGIRGLERNRHGFPGTGRRKSA